MEYDFLGRQGLLIPFGYTLFFFSIEDTFSRNMKNSIDIPFLHGLSYYVQCQLIVI
jgi:hypothetical protein